jgi:hypothetical protein
MTRTSLRYATLALALGATALVPLQATHAASSVLLRAHFTVGQKYSSVETKVDTMKFTLKIPVANGPAQTTSQTSNEKDVIPSTDTIMKVNADGSALRRTTYGTVSVTSDGKTTTSAMKGYHEDDQISTRLRTISTKVVGAAGIPKAIQDAIGANTSGTQLTANYPVAPVSVGSSWPLSAAIPGMGKLSATVTVLSFGTQAGRQTVTIQISVNQMLHTSSQGLTFGGPIVGNEKDTIFIDSGEKATPSKGTLSWKGKLSGTVSGTKATGTFTFSEIDSTVPSM